LHLQELLNHNAKVYLAARSEVKANAAIAELKSVTGKEAIFLQLDLADITGVRRSAEEFLSYVPSVVCVLCAIIAKTVCSARRVSCTFSSIMRKEFLSRGHCVRVLGLTRIAVV
jgi:NAD(P)-dependent dehydrogenase (short-subunit alcohol dehydrogenase family)